MKRLLVILALVFAVFAAGCSSLTENDQAADPVVTTPTTGTIRSEPADDVDAGQQDADQPTTDADAAPDTADLVWTVIAVERDDVLNVREDPDVVAPLVDTLAPWTTDLEVLDQVEVTANGTWRLVRTPARAVGWVNSRFLVAQPRQLSQGDQEELIARAADLVEEATTGGADGDLGSMLADRALWVGGLGIYGDGVAGWNWFPAGDVARTEDWNRVRTFELGPDFGDFDCGSECDKSINDFMKFDRIDDSTRFLVDDIPDANGRGFLDGALWQAPEALHRVVIDTPTSDPQVALDWQRIHVVFDWSRGDAEVILINTHGWTP